MSVSQFMSAKPECRLVMPVGSFTAWSMEFSPMAKCQAIRPLEAGTIPSTPFSAKPEQENTSLVPFLWTWNQQLLVSSKRNQPLKFSTFLSVSYSFCIDLITIFGSHLDG